MVFLLAETAGPVDRVTTTAIGDLRQIAALLEGLRALGSGRVLDDVLSLVLDSAIEVSGAERGFIMLAIGSEELEFKMARGRGHVTVRIEVQNGGTIALENNQSGTYGLTSEFGDETGVKYVNGATYNFVAVQGGIAHFQPQIAGKGKRDSLL